MLFGVYRESNGSLRAKHNIPIYGPLESLFRGVLFGIKMRRQIIPYDPHLKERARELRNNATRSEILLWEHLQRKQVLGYDFHRQRPIDKFIVDFFCSELCLAIEIDGNSHNEKFETDEARQRRLESLGVRLLRFLDEDVKNNTEGVMMEIENWIKRHTPPYGHPSREGKREKSDSGFMR